jgi:uncharacterized iron-regulated protein
MKSVSRHLAWPLLLAGVMLSACATSPSLLNIDGYDQSLAPGTIFDTAGGKAIGFDQLIEQLSQARVIYVGERHTAMAHHRVQLKIIQALTEKKGHIRVGMEMFDYTYQPKLDQWSTGKLQWDDFLKQVHWYANWRYDDILYKEILDYIQERRLTLVGINIPFHLPPKIAVGGLESLSKSERALLPDTIDTSQSDHRAYVEEIFKTHAIKGREDFNNFYAAQCAWEDGMAQAIADHLGPETMVVVVGNGHIVKKFGIPKRAFARNQLPFRTVYLATPDMAVSRQDGDFIWVTPAEKPVMHGMMKP